jgi:hypothetical protein
VRPKPSPRAAKKEPEKQALKKHQAANKYDEGQGLDRKGDARGAYLAYVEAGNATGARRKGWERSTRRAARSSVDYAMALRWYEKARAQGIEVPKPHAYTKGH